MMDIRTDAKNLDDRSLEYIHSLGCYFKPDEVFIRPRQTVTFDSPLSLFVIKYLATGNAQVVGRTPGDNPVAFNLDPGDSWTLYAPGLVSSDLGQLVMDINDHSVPSLILNRGELVQSDLVQLAGAPTLTTLGLGTDWTSLAGIQELTQLVTLIIDNNHRITDTELSLLTGLASLEELMLTSSSNISNAGMPHLAALAGLKRLYLNRTSVDDVGIATLLSGAPSMTGLHMEQLGVTDNTVAQVISRPSMVELDFDETHISDSGAAQLGALTSLKVLDLRDNKGGLIQNATLLSLTNALPTCAVSASHPRTSMTRAWLISAILLRWRS